ncbi:NAD(P)H-dependent flavin oxidoreductase [Orrella daihaiensis]|uniref:Propionate 3-nitronate monooxygenase n=1 Tax=Orrella daihaiensis TaxID=2782176 RepID=A0ABY4AIP6_9BURK|nr:nitronate monooxygenase [Orrella daihaiensis]UOD50049.1 nitronate monooxygenase [Orrella daihaiensis]
MFNFKHLALPIIQAPMAGGVCTPELVAAVANAGGVGSFGFAYSTPKKIAEDLAAARALTTGPINANFFVFAPVRLPDVGTQQKAISALRDLPIAKNVLIDNLTVPIEPFYPDLHEQLAPVWEHKPDVLTFHFGIPDASVIDKAHALGITVGLTATCVTDALTIQAAGADFVVAQGIEAGGHRGIFEVDAADEQLTTLALTMQLSMHCTIPIVSAGGIMHGTDIRAAINAGATAAQLGTAFLCCDESGASAAHKHYLINERKRASVITKAFSGRPARGIDNAYIKHMKDQVILPFPIQNTLTGPMRKWATDTNNGEYQSLWAGTKYHRSRAMPAAELMQTLSGELA